MDFLYDKNLKYINILNRIHKKISIEEGFLIMIRLYLTNNYFYYTICILFRFISLIIISGDYKNYFDKEELIDNNFNVMQFFRKLTCHNIIKQIHISDIIYIELCILILILFLIRIVIYLNLIKRLKNYKNLNIWPVPGKFQIITDHIIFLIFPYLLEFLSFSYYIYLFPDKFIIKYNSENKILLFIIIIVNTLLIIGYNINNYIFLLCSNKIYTTNKFEAFSRMKNEKDYKYQSRISYRSSNIILYNYIILQNFVIFQTTGNYVVNNYKIYY